MGLLHRCVGLIPLRWLLLLLLSLLFITYLADVWSFSIHLLKTNPPEQKHLYPIQPGIHSSTNGNILSLHPLRSKDSGQYIKNFTSNEKNSNRRGSTIHKLSSLDKIVNITDFISSVKRTSTITDRRVASSSNDAEQDIDTVWQSVVSDGSSVETTVQSYAVADSVAGQLTADNIPQISPPSINCAKLFTGDPSEQQKARFFQQHNQKVPISPEELIAQAADCAIFKNARKYITKPISEEEASFPIAFSLIVFKDIEQVERLLRAIYRPQNYYCVHVDQKVVGSPFHQAIEAIEKCFSNVFIASESVDVQWGSFSVLEPEFICMKQLWRYSKWKYFINLTGQEWPLKTNLDLVRILKTYTGANNMEGTVARRNKARTEFVHDGYYQTIMRHSPVPEGIVLTKGSVHITASRAFVDYILHDEFALEFREWVKDTGVPDETYFSSLNHSPKLGVPGAYKGIPETDTKYYYFLTRFKNWGNGPFNWACHGKRVRLVCVFGVGDLPLLVSRPELFANKFYLTYEPLALDCMEQRHYNHTREQFYGRNILDLDFYKSQAFVLNHV